MISTEQINQLRSMCSDSLSRLLEQLLKHKEGILQSIGKYPLEICMPNKATIFDYGNDPVLFRCVISKHLDYAFLVHEILTTLNTRGIKPRNISEGPYR